MAEVVVVATLVAKPDSEDEVGEMLAASIPDVHEEDGCILYALHRGAQDPATFVFVERWASADQLEVHARSPALQEALPRIAPLLTGPPQITPLIPVAAGDPAKGTLAGSD
jgi:quinol monooxygenase YgiN